MTPGFRETKSTTFLALVPGGGSNPQSVIICLNAWDVPKSIGKCPNHLFWCLRCAQIDICRRCLNNLSPATSPGYRLLVQDAGYSFRMARTSPG